MSVLYAYCSVQTRLCPARVEILTVVAIITVGTYAVILAFVGRTGAAIMTQTLRTARITVLTVVSEKIWSASTMTLSVPYVAHSVVLARLHTQVHLFTVGAMVARGTEAVVLASPAHTGTAMLARPLVAQVAKLARFAVVAIDTVAAEEIPHRLTNTSVLTLVNLTRHDSLTVLAVVSQLAFALVTH